MTYVIVFLISYLIGSIPFGLLLTKAAGLGDIRTIGSGNIGATNVLRTGNKKLAALTLLLDGVKGWVAALLGLAFSFTSQCDDMPDCIPLLVDPFIIAIVAVLIGHIFPLWLKFKGGKGVATYIGVLFCLPVLGIAACLVWVIVAFLTRISSLSALVMLFIIPLLTLKLFPQIAPSIAFMSLLVIYRHKDNIKRLLAGTEPKIGAKKK